MSIFVWYSPWFPDILNHCWKVCLLGFSFSALRTKSEYQSGSLVICMKLVLGSIALLWKLHAMFCVFLGKVFVPLRVFATNRKEGRWEREVTVHGCFYSSLQVSLNKYLHSSETTGYKIIHLKL